jgi:muramoyltetrapeptide carboxypeptidase LdcA involved in peptidoglycan recycling
LLEIGCKVLRELGYKPFYFDSILEQDLYFAGSVQRRARELEEMFTRPEVRAIVCARGGYGTNYLLDAIDVEKITSHPKIFVGYSDVTTLLTYWLLFTARWSQRISPIPAEPIWIPGEQPLLERPNGVWGPSPELNHW